MDWPARDDDLDADCPRVVEEPQDPFGEVHAFLHSFYGEQQSAGAREDLTVTLVQALTAGLDS